MITSDRSLPYKFLPKSFCFSTWEMRERLPKTGAKCKGVVDGGAWPQHINAGGGGRCKAKQGRVSRGKSLETGVSTLTLSSSVLNAYNIQMRKTH